MYKIIELTNLTNNKIYRFFIYKDIKLNTIGQIKRTIRPNNELYIDIQHLELDKIKIEVLFECNDKNIFNKNKNIYISNEFKKRNDTYNIPTNHVKNRVIVKDSNGKCLSIDNKDPRYLSGELVCNTKNRITVKDSSSNFLSVDKQDPRYLSGELVSKTTGMVVVKNNKGEQFLTSNIDPNYINGTYTHVNTNKVKINNRHINIDEVKENEKTRYNEIYPAFDKQILYKNKNLYVKNYCEHGDLYINRGNFNSIYNAVNGDKIYCEHCRSNILTNNLTNKPREEYISLLDNIHVTNLNIKFLFQNYPYLYSYIYNFTNDKKLSLHDKLILFKKNIKELPKCNYISCNNNVVFSKCHATFLKYCEKHLQSGTSNLEKEVADFISIYEPNIHRNYRKLGKEIDIYIPYKNIGFEVNGLYWHSDEYKEKDYHIDKLNYFKNKGIKLITIWEDDWNFKQDIVKSMIINSLGLIEKNNKINARSCHIKEVNYFTTKLFLDNNHIQGNIPSKINLGLFYDNDLVSIMTFGKNRMILNQNQESNEYELLRLCSLKNKQVRGGASKLLKYFINKYIPNKITSFSNNDIGSGEMYKILNFTQESYSNNINYWWSKDGVKYHRSKFMKHKLVKEGEDPSLTENEIMRKNGYNKIYGSGTLKWVMIL